MFELDLLLCGEGLREAEGEARRGQDHENVDTSHFVYSICKKVKGAPNEKHRTELNQLAFFLFHMDICNFPVELQRLIFASNSSDSDLKAWRMGTLAKEYLSGILILRLVCKR